MKFSIEIQRTEIWTATVEVEADSEEEAKEITQEKLCSEGWDSVCNYDGEYEECWAEVVGYADLGEVSEEDEEE